MDPLVTDTTFRLVVFTPLGIAVLVLLTSVAHQIWKDRR